MHQYYQIYYYHCKEMEQKKLTVATLNYCDIMNNPFEFYCEQYQKELEQISSIFVKLIPTYIPTYTKQKFGWSMGKIDHKVRIGRYTPAFISEAGIVDDHFITKQQYDKIWDEYFCKINTKHVAYTQQERINARLYDFLLYHALLVYVYQNQPFSELIKNNPQYYRKIIKPFYELSFLCKKKKLDKIMSSFSNISADIFFIQEYSQKFHQAVIKTGQYHTFNDDSKDTLIIVKKETFKQCIDLKDALSENELKMLNWADRSTIAVFDNYIIVNTHLNSKADKSKIQINELKKALYQIKKTHPNHQIIVGGDLNSFLGNDQLFETDFNIYPALQNQVTTVKKRTMCQAQFHKGNKLVAESKDKIISTLPIIQASVRYINNEKPNNQSLIPSDRHPFDHYVLVAQLRRI